MKALRRVGLATLAAISLVALVWAQQEPHNMDEHAGHMGHHMQAMGVKLDAQDDAAHHTLTVRVGPVNLPAHSDHHAVAQPPRLYLNIPFDGWITAYHPRLTDESGNPEANKLLHHVAFFNTSRADFLCPQKPEHIFGAGGEMNDWPTLPGIGYRVHPGDRILVTTMWHNPTDVNYPKTYLEVRIEYVPSTPSGPQVKNVYPTWFDVKECGESGYDLKPGINVTTGEMTVGYSGILLGVGGHLHDYGQGLKLEDTTRKEVVANLPSNLDPQGRILSMPIVTFMNRGGYRLNKGEIMRITATYNNLAGKPLPEGAMGIVVGYFLPDKDTEMAALHKPSGK